MANEEHLAILKQGVRAWNNWRSKNPDVRPDLSSVLLDEEELSTIDFSNTILSNAEIRHAFLFEANLTHAILWNTNLSNTYLENADLSHAMLGEANLFAVKLSGAKLTGAKLQFTKQLMGSIYERGADFTSANLHQADFSHSICGATIFANVNLSSAKGLETVTHRGRSFIGINTLERSRGQIPEVFLRGCGLSDKSIKFANSFVAGPEFYSCFISYSTADVDFAKLLYDKLQGAGIRCWFAPEQILPGERIDEAIDYGIRYWDKVLFCASKSSLTEKWWVDFEVDKAFKKSRDLQRERGEQVGVIVPLNLDDYLFGPEYEKNPKRSIFEVTLAADFVGWRNDLGKFNREVEKVIKALRTEGGKEAPPEPKL